MRSKDEAIEDWKAKYKRLEGAFGFFISSVRIDNEHFAREFNIDEIEHGLQEMKVEDHGLSVKVSYGLGS